ncbi:heavy-metal-associated domain-containing protein [Alkalibacterium kapii]|uniref:HMA domain-containing protein n=1 Tax=Alkalibacterium kapii TaxID=426704 RepID=A0A511AU70_9LACT|nr:heavy metal-associated domain-containing protein [Alkalibacterium kapii]GEK91739.1 hypothetical protein AKA01nite_13610 [Alkalibacterium kapii]
MIKEVTVEGMKCQGCANTVKENFSSIEGVDSVEVDVANNKVTVESQKEIDKQTLKSALSDTKYTVKG